MLLQFLMYPLKPQKYKKMKLKPIEFSFYLRMSASVDFVYFCMWKDQVTTRCLYIPPICPLQFVPRVAAPTGP